jgi:hypothetical protein
MSALRQSPCLPAACLVRYSGYWECRCRCHCCRAREVCWQDGELERVLHGPACPRSELPHRQHADVFRSTVQSSSHPPTAKPTVSVMACGNHLFRGGPLCHQVGCASPVHWGLLLYKPRCMLHLALYALHLRAMASSEAGCAAALLHAQLLRRGLCYLLQVPVVGDVLTWVEAAEKLGVLTGKKASQRAGMLPVHVPAWLGAASLSHGERGSAAVSNKAANMLVEAQAGAVHTGSHGPGCTCNALHWTPVGDVHSGSRTPHSGRSTAAGYRGHAPCRCLGRASHAVWCAGAGCQRPGQHVSLPLAATRLALLTGPPSHQTKCG